MLKGQPAGSTGQPVAYIDNFGGVSPTLNQVPFTFAFDLNTGKVSLNVRSLGCQQISTLPSSISRNSTGPAAKTLSSIRIKPPTTPAT